MKQKILVLCLGTSCDFRLMDYAIHSIINPHKRFSIIYISDSKHIVPTDCTGVYYETPDFVTEDPDLPLANTKMNDIYWGVVNIFKLYDALGFYKDLTKLLLGTIEKYDPIALCILYPALGVLCRLPSEIFDKVPAHVIYYAPGFPNKEIPWLFDSRLKSSRFSIYKKKWVQNNIESGDKYISRILIGTGNEKNILDKMNHVLCWDKNIIPSSVFPSYANVIRKGALNPTVKFMEKWPQVPRKLSPLFVRENNMIFMSFGTYGQSDLLLTCLPILLQKLQAFCLKNNYFVLFHNPHSSISLTGTTEWLYQFTGYVPYEFVVPRSKLVIFTGSVCLQNICFYHKVPMLFLPLLSEQFFWSWNYKHYTDIKFINYKKQRNSIDIKKAIHSSKVKSYLRKVSNSMHKPVEPLKF